jgi:phenylpyruvate tautomerase PptA (4-oxalocrotonate tautomerase family)
MPLLDVECVRPEGQALPAATAQALADAAAGVLGSAPAHVWVRVRVLASSAYAENGAAVANDELPVFVTLLHAHPPQGPALAAQVRALTDALAAALGVDSGRVHLALAPAGAGRQAFGGRLVE